MAGQGGVQFEQPPVEPGDVVPVAPALVELDHVGEEQAAIHGWPARSPISR